MFGAVQSSAHQNNNNNNNNNNNRHPLCLHAHAGQPIIDQCVLHFQAHAGHGPPLFHVRAAACIRLEVPQSPLRWQQFPVATSSAALKKTRMFCD